MKLLSKIFVNTGLFSVLSLILVLPILATVAVNFSNKPSENTEVLSAQDSNVEKSEPVDDTPEELKEIIKRVELEMYKEAVEANRQK